MNSLILREACTLIKGFPALITLTRFIPRMTSLMSKADALAEGFATFSAFITFLAGMNL